MPDGYMHQIGSYNFKFDIITSSKAFQRHMDYAISHDLVRDVSDDTMSELSEDKILEIPHKRYINVVQKSPTWLYLRAQAQGTASSVGKYLKSPCRYPTLDQIRENWIDKITKKPFQKTHTMLGHMNWGVGYEDPALIHFAREQDVGVIQVGTIRVDLNYILALGKSIYGKKWQVLPKIVEGQHLLISPDGIVGKPEKRYFGQKGIRTEFYEDLLGMLEIKCMSPFYHVETSDNYLVWVDDIESRQWYQPEQVPFVYIVQMTLQAISGAYAYKMTPKHTMWFIRWSPHGVSIFEFSFKNLIRMGVLVCNLYFSLIQRTHTVEDVDRLYPLSGAEAEVESQMNQAYFTLMREAKHRYVNIDDYPEFDIYNLVTQHYKFMVPDMDPELLMLDLPKNKFEEGQDLNSCLI